MQISLFSMDYISVYIKLPNQTLLIFQHHCKKCGKVFCQRCSDNFVFLPCSSKPCRVCNECAEKLADRLRRFKVEKSKETIRSPSESSEPPQVKEEDLNQYVTFQQVLKERAEAEP